MRFLKDNKRNKDFDKENLLELDDKDLTYIVKHIVKNPYSEFYDDFYVSKYSSDTATTHRNASQYQQIMEHITKQSNNYIYSEVQSNSQSYFYTYVNGGRNGDKLGYRIYLAPNPENLHYIAQEFAKNTYKNNINVEFKVQRQNDSKKRKIDRMIVYCTNKQNLIECLAVFEKIQRKAPQAFYESEKSPIWYNSQVKNVFIAPEIMQEGESYGDVFEKSSKELVSLLKYFYDCQNISEYERLLTPVQQVKFYNFAKLLLRSTLLKNSCCLKKNYDNIYKKSEPTYRYLANGKIRSVYNREDGKDEIAIFENSNEGKKFLLNNFYSTPGELENNPEVSVSVTNNNRFFYPYQG